MEFLGELLIEIVGCIAEIIGEVLAEFFHRKSNGKLSATKVLIGVATVLFCCALITSLGFAAYILFANSHPIFGFLVAIVAFFFIILVISVSVKLKQIKNK